MIVHAGSTSWLSSTPPALHTPPCGRFPRAHHHKSTCVLSQCLILQREHSALAYIPIGFDSEIPKLILFLHAGDDKICSNIVILSNGLVGHTLHSTVLQQGIHFVHACDSMGHSLSGVLLGDVMPRNNHDIRNDHDILSHSLCPLPL